MTNKSLSDKKVKMYQKEDLINSFDVYLDEDVKKAVKDVEEITKPRSFNEEITLMMNKRGWRSADEHECIWVCCNIIKDYIKERRDKIFGDKLTNGE